MSLKDTAKHKNKIYPGIRLKDEYTEEEVFVVELTDVSASEYTVLYNFDGSSVSVAEYNNKLDAWDGEVEDDESVIECVFANDINSIAQTDKYETIFYSYNPIKFKRGVKASTIRELAKENGFRIYAFPISRLTKTQK